MRYTRHDVSETDSNPDDDRSWVKRTSDAVALGSGAPRHVCQGYCRQHRRNTGVSTSGIVAVTRIDGRRLTRSGAMGIDSETDMQRQDLQIMLKFGLFQAIRTGGLTARDGTIRGFRLSPAAADVRYSSAHEQAAHDGIDKLFHRRQII
jgi:hypothetical protein